MNSVNGEYFPSGQARPLPAELFFENRTAQLRCENHDGLFTLDQLIISDRLEGVPRTVDLPDGGQFSTMNNDAVDQWLASNGYVPGFSIVSLFERSWRWVLVALAAIPVSLYLLFTFAMPVVARPLAAAVPESVKHRMDSEFVELLDEQFLGPSVIDEVSQQQILELYQGHPQSAGTQLHFRNGGAIGANALALPGGTVIITDQLVELIDSDGEAMAVLFHEIGHIERNHSMRSLMQAAGAGMVMGWLLGDLSVVTDFVLVGAPLLLQRLSYSRTMEREADEFALRALVSEAYSAQCFSSLMDKLARSHGAQDSAIPDFLSSHPSMGERISHGELARSCRKNASRVEWSRIQLADSVEEEDLGSE